MSAKRYAAVDLGASSGRVLVGAVTETTVELTGVHRFANEPVRLPHGLHWDLLGLYRQIRKGLAGAGPVASAGIDSWAVDYGLIDEDGSLLRLPFHYRDERTAALPEWSDPAGLWRATGIADQPFNTLHQVRAESNRRLERTTHLLMIPDLLAYWLTGEIGAEHTNASTTGLYGVEGGWSAAVASAAGIDISILPPVRRPGDRIGATDCGTHLIAVAPGSRNNGPGSSWSRASRLSRTRSAWRTWASTASPCRTTAGDSWTAPRSPSTCSPRW